MVVVEEWDGEVGLFVLYTVQSSVLPLRGNLLSASIHVASLLSDVHEPSAGTE